MYAADSVFYKNFFVPIDFEEKNPSGASWYKYLPISTPFDSYSMSLDSPFNFLWIVSFGHPDVHCKREGSPQTAAFFSIREN
jgi:hypothetical protein